MSNSNSDENVCFEKYENLDLNSLIKEIPNDSYLYDMSEIIKAISDPLRLKILYLLKNGELCACHIDSGLNKPQSTISHHLAILKKSGLIKWRKDGKWTHFSLKNSILIELIEKIIKIEEE